MLIGVTLIRSIRSDKQIYVNTDLIKTVVPVDRNYTEMCSDIHLVTGEVLKTNCYIKTLQSAMGRQ